MSRFDDLRKRYVEWSKSEREWSELGRTLPWKLRQAFAAFLGVSDDGERPFGPDDGMYVDLYAPLEPGETQVDYKRAQGAQPSVQQPDGAWLFTIGVVIDARRHSPDNLRLFFPCELTRIDGIEEHLAVRLSRGSSSDVFSLDPAEPESCIELFERLFEILEGYLSAPYPGGSKNTIGFALSRAASSR